MNAEAKWRMFNLKVSEFQKAGSRLGQAYFNALNVVDPDLADEIRGTEFDPFYSNGSPLYSNGAVIESFVMRISQSWDI